MTTCRDCGCWVRVDVDTHASPRVQIRARCECPTEPPREGDTR